MILFRNHLKHLVQLIAMDSFSRDRAPESKVNNLFYPVGKLSHNPAWKGGLIPLPRKKKRPVVTTSVSDPVFLAFSGSGSERTLEMF